MVIPLHLGRNNRLSIYYIHEIIIFKDLGLKILYLKMWIFQQAIETLNDSSIYIPGSNIRNTFNNLKRIFSGTRGLKNYADLIRRMYYFSQTKRDNVTVEELLNEIDGKLLFTNKITVLEEIVEKLSNKEQIDEKTAVYFSSFLLRSFLSYSFAQSYKLS